MRIDVKQRSAAWFDARVGKITASRAPAILGESPYKTRDDVMREMVREYHGAASEFRGNVATEWGNEHEHVARAEYSFDESVVVQDGGFFVHDTYEWAAASPDGLIGDDTVVEIKCPYRGKYRSLFDRPHYITQIEHQLWCTGRRKAIGVVWHGEGDYNYDVIGDNPFYENQALPVFLEFIRDYTRIIADDELSAPYLDPREIITPEWRDAAAEYRAAKAEYEERKSEMKTAKDRLDSALLALQSLAPAGGRGYGITMSAKIREGRVSYKNALKSLAPNADLSPFRAPATTHYSVKIGDDK